MKFYLITNKIYYITLKIDTISYPFYFIVITVYNKTKKI